MNFFDLSFNVAALVLAACSGISSLLAPTPEVALIIDDVGYDYARGRAAIDLSLPLTISVLPFSPHAKHLAHYANTSGKDVMVHVPMEAESHNHLLGPGALLSAMSRPEFELALAESLDEIPEAIGVNNHMGSKLTREPLAMKWLMEAISGRGTLFFVDSRTTSASVALGAARVAQLRATARDIFIDNVQTRDHVTQQLAMLVSYARTHGRALAIGHPHGATLEALTAWDPTAAGVRVVSLSAYLNPAAATSLASAECGEHGNDTYAAQDPYAQR